MPDSYRLYCTYSIEKYYSIFVYCSLQLVTHKCPVIFVCFFQHALILLEQVHKYTIVQLQLRLHSCSKERSTIFDLGQFISIGFCYWGEKKVLFRKSLQLLYCAQKMSKFTAQVQPIRRGVLGKVLRMSIHFLSMKKEFAFTDMSCSSFDLLASSICRVSRASCRRFFKVCKVSSIV